MKKDKTPYKILQILKDGQFHSGEDLGHMLDITRSAIWKGVKYLTAHFNLEIQSISGRGYRIEGGLNLLDEQLILNNLKPDERSQLQLTVLEQVDSTNTYLLETAKQEPQDTQPFHLVVAEQQTAGRGRRGREWASPYGNNIYYSLAWRCNKDPFELSGLSLAVAIAIIRTLKQFGLTDLSVKWPNDILFHGRKLAGVLVDLVGESHGRTTVIIGIGINTFLTNKAGSDIEQPWVSIHDILDRHVDRNEIISLLTHHIIEIIKQFDHDGLAPLVSEWNQHDAFKGKSVRLFNGTQEVIGTMRGINEQGALLLEDDQQQIKPYISGELSMREHT